MPDKVALLDVDGVLLNIIPAVQKYILEEYDVSILPEHISCWDWDYCLGFPTKDFLSEKFWTYVWNTPVHMYPAAEWFISELKRYGYFVYGISHRSDWEAQVAAKRDFPQLELDDYVLTKEKAEFINNKFPDATFMVEDNPINAVGIGTETKVKSYLMNRPWNKNCVTITNAWTRVYGYDDILRAIKLGDTKAYFE